MRSSEVLLAITGIVILAGIALIGSLESDYCTHQVVTEDEYEDGTTMVTVYNSTDDGNLQQERSFRIIK